MNEIYKILKICTVALAVLLTAGTAWGQFGGGNGTYSDPYRISTEAHLAAIATNVNNGTETYTGVYFKVTDNITYSGSAIGRYDGSSRYFSGVFDGDGHAITVNITGDRAALFGKVEGTLSNKVVIKNLTIKGTVTVTGTCGAGLVADAGSSAIGGIVIENCRNEAIVTSSSCGCLGGIIGKISGNSVVLPATVTNCSNTGNITANGSHVGGIAGEIHSNTIISKCKNSGNVKADSGDGNYAVGGIVGGSTGDDNSNLNIIRDCINTGDVEGDHIVGGIAGRIEKTTLDHCGCPNSTKTFKVTTALEKYSALGGIVGYTYSIDSIRNCYNRAYLDGSACLRQTTNVTASEIGVGGIVGTSGESYGKCAIIENCYNIGTVYSPNSYFVGGVCGAVETKITIHNCYNGGTVSGFNANYTGNIIGRWATGGTCSNVYARDGFCALNTNKMYGTISSYNPTTPYGFFTHTTETNTICTYNSSDDGLLNILNEWVTNNNSSGRYKTWIDDVSPWSNKGMPPFDKTNDDMICGRTYTGETTQTNTIVCVSGSNVGSGGEAFYRFVATATGNHSFSIMVTSGVPVVAVVATDCNANTVLASTVVNPTSTEVILSADLEEGTEYYIILDSYVTNYPSVYSITASCPNGSVMAAECNDFNATTVGSLPSGWTYSVNVHPNPNPSNPNVWQRYSTSPATLSIINAQHSDMINADLQPYRSSETCAAVGSECLYIEYAPARATYCQDVFLYPSVMHLFPGTYSYSVLYSAEVDMSINANTESSEGRYVGSVCDLYYGTTADYTQMTQMSDITWHDMSGGYVFTRPVIACNSFVQIKGTFEITSEGDYYVGMKVHANCPVSQNNTHQAWMTLDNFCIEPLTTIITCEHLVAPTVTIETQADRSVTVSWNAVEHADSYTLLYGSAGSLNMWRDDNVSATYNAGTNTYTYIIYELTNGQSYNFAIMPVGSDTYCPDNPITSTIGTPECNE